MSQYVDTSVLVAYYAPEPLSAKVQRTLAALESPALSVLAEVELFSAITRKQRAGETNLDSARRMLAQFRSHLAAGYYRLLPVEADHYVQAREWISEMKTPLRTLDALHLAVAFSAGLQIVTADRLLAKSARHYGAKVQLLTP